MRAITSPRSEETEMTPIAAADPGLVHLNALLSRLELHEDGVCHVPGCVHLAHEETFEPDAVPRLAA
jgi:hypothetical protein